MSDTAQRSALLAFTILQSAVSDRSKENARMVTAFSDRMPVSIRSEIDRRQEEIDLLSPIIEDLRVKAGQ